LLGPTAVCIIVLQEVGLVGKFFLNFSFALPVLVSIPVSLLLEIRLQAEVKPRRRER
jgi:anaerobic C4-dicarboxylate transporter